MKLSSEDVHHLADLARIELTESEVESFRDEVSAVLEYVDRLQKIDTTNVEMHTPPAQAEGWRVDVVDACDRDVIASILNQFPEREGDFLRTPAIFSSPKKTR